VSDLQLANGRAERLIARRLRSGDAAIPLVASAKN
jgi:hypothetical protein